MEEEASMYERDKSDILVKFLGVGAIVMFAGTIPMLLGAFFDDTRKRRNE